MKRRFDPLPAAALLGVFCFLAPSQAVAGARSDQVKSTVDQVITVLNDPQLKPESKRKERRVQVREILLPQFDFAEMAKRSLGSHWRSRTPEQQREFVRIFTDLIEASYVDKIEILTDEKFLYTGESQDNTHAHVDTKVLLKRGEPISLSYKLYLVDEAWKVYDVVIENISLVNNYRSQFNRVVSGSSYEELVRRLKEKQVEVVGGRKS